MDRLHKQFNAREFDETRIRDLYALLDGLSDDELRELAKELSRRINGHALVEGLVMKYAVGELDSISGWFGNALDKYNRGLDVERPARRASAGRSVSVNY